MCRDIIKDLTFFIIAYFTRDYYNQQVFNERDVVLPHTGEIVAAHYMDDGYWYRGRVIDSMNDTLSVSKVTIQRVFKSTPHCLQMCLLHVQDSCLHIRLHICCMSVHGLVFGSSNVPEDTGIIVFSWFIFIVGVFC